VLSNGTLIVRRVSDSDVGVYRCVGTGRTGPVQTFAAQLLLACKSPVFTCICSYSTCRLCDKLFSALSSAANAMHRKHLQLSIKFQLWHSIFTIFANLLYPDISSHMRFRFINSL